MLKDEQLKKWIKRAAKVGVLLGFVCNQLPHDYQVVCNAIADACRGGLGL